MPAFVSRLIAWALRLKIVRAVLLYSGKRGAQLADGVTYRTLFSVFAAVLLGFSLAAAWLAGNPRAWSALVSAVDSAIPGLVGDDGLIDVSTIQAPAGLTFAGIISSVGLIGAAIGAISALRWALRTIGSQRTDDSGFVWVMVRNLILAAVIGAGFVAAAAATVLANAGIGVIQDWLGLPEDGPRVQVTTWVVSALIVLALDTVIVAGSFLLLSGMKPRARVLWTGALLGGVGLSVLQQLSSLFVGGATRNPLLATFASLIALLLWLNLSTQVILIASAYIVIGIEEDTDRVHARYGAATLAQHRVRRAEVAVQAAADELHAARRAEEEEREKALGSVSERSG